MSNDPYWTFESPSLASELNEVREYLGLPETDSPEDVCVAAVRAVDELGRFYSQEWALLQLFRRWEADPVSASCAAELKAVLESAY